MKRMRKKAEGVKRINAYAETAKACGNLSERTVHKIAKQAKLEPILITPGHKRKKRIVIDAFLVDSIGTHDPRLLQVQQAVLRIRVAQPIAYSASLPVRTAHTGADSEAERF